VIIKHFFLPTASALAALAACLAATLPADAIGVTVNGSPVDIYPSPIIQDGRVFVPLRGVFEQLGASVVYSNGTIDANGNGRDISLQIGSTQATVNGQPQTVDVAPFIVGASTYVPLRFISEALGDNVEWDDADQIAQIDTGGGGATYFSPGTASYVDTPPPPIPEYDQPYVPEPNYIWQPGYWAWGSYGYYWVPGTWVAAPQPGYLWTPGYWQANNGGYNWSPGYWAVAIGFYGGINYGGGYFGHGYDGGRWSGNTFRYNSYVSHVNVTIIKNVYVDRTVYVNPSAARVSFVGGHGGLQARPTPQEAAVVKARHLGMTPVQRQHVQTAEADRNLLATVNHNKPPVLAVARPLTPAARPAGFVPVKPADRVNPQANVAPVPVPNVRAARVAAPPAAARIAPPAAARVAPPAAARVAPPAAAHVAPPAAAHVAPPAAAHVAPPAAAHVAPPAAARIAPPAATHVAPVVHVAAPAAHPAVVHVAPAAPVAPVVHVAAPAPHPAVVHEAAPAPRVPSVFAAPPAHAPVVHVAAPPPHPPVVHAAPAPAAHAAPAAHPASPPHPAPKDDDKKPPR